MSKNSKNPHANIYNRDGRINPDKALALVTKIVKSKTPAEVRKLVEKPVVLRGSDGKPLPKRKR